MNLPPREAGVYVLGGLLVGALLGRTTAPRPTPARIVSDEREHVTTFGYTGTVIRTQTAAQSVTNWHTKEKIVYLPGGRVELERDTDVSQARETVKTTDAQQVATQKTDATESRVVRVEPPAPPGWALGAAAGLAATGARIGAVRVERRLFGRLWITVEGTTQPAVLAGLRGEF